MELSPVFAHTIDTFGVIIIGISVMCMFAYLFLIWRLTKKLPGPTGLILTSTKKIEEDLKEIDKTLDQISTTVNVMRQNLQKLK